MDRQMQEMTGQRPRRLPGSAAPISPASDEKDSGELDASGSADIENECTVCYRDCDDPTVGIIRLDDCEHYLCKTCMQRHISIAINNGNCATMTCSYRGETQEEHCFRIISDAEVQRIAPPDIYANYMERMAVLNLKKKGAIWCPNPKQGGCQSQVIPNQDNPMTICPQCDYIFCSNPRCKVLDATDILVFAKWHEDKSCRVFQETIIRQAGATPSKQCPGIVENGLRCQEQIQKNEGCNHMKLLHVSTTSAGHVCTRTRSTIKQCHHQTL